MGGVRDWLVGGGDDSAVAMGGDLPQRPRRRGEDLRRRGNPTRTFSDSAGGTDVQTTGFRWWVWLVGVGCVGLTSSAEWESSAASVACLLVPCNSISRLAYRGLGSIRKL